MYSTYTVFVWRYCTFVCIVQGSTGVAYQDRSSCGLPAPALGVPGRREAFMRRIHTHPSL